MIPPEERRRLLALARGAIHNFVRDEALPGEPFGAAGRERKGVFVTIHHRGKLRGCIGRTDSTESLESLVATCAVLAASRDPRFSPVQAGEVEELELEISLLTPPEEVAAERVLDALTPGIHGVSVRQGGSRGLLLPQVAAEHRWDARRFLEETCRKAGLPSRAWCDRATCIELFTAEVFSERENPRQDLPARPAPR